MSNKIIVKNVKNCIKLSKIIKNCQECQNCQKLAALSKNLNCKKIIKIVENYQKLSKIVNLKKNIFLKSTIVKILQKRIQVMSHHQMSQVYFLCQKVKCLVIRDRGRYRAVSDSRLSS